ncbi:hypothetical protein LPJ53_001759, partial [Coemansia erecta]
PEKPPQLSPPPESARAPPPPPPPPPTSSSVRLAAAAAAPRNAASATPLHTSHSRPAISRAESSASVYKDFTGGGHADNGHWNDPPAAVFRSGGGGNTSGSNSGTASRAEGFTVVDGATTPNGTMVAEEVEDVPETRGEQEEVVRSELVAALEALQGGQAAGKVLEDTRRRVDVLLGSDAGEAGRLEEIDGRLLEQVCRLCVLLKAGKFAEALAAHREAVVLPGGDLELRWLVGVKRLVELRSKSVS